MLLLGQLSGKLVSDCKNRQFRTGRMNQCALGVNADEAIASSPAIFLGQVVELRTKVNSTPGLTLRGSGSGSSEELAKFKVLKSWKLVDKEYVWLKSQGFRLRCGRLEDGKIYLVYADELSGEMYINPDSRTMSADEEAEISDVAKLGPSVLILSKGEFHDYSIPLIGYGAFLFILFVVIFLTYRLYKAK